MPQITWFQRLRLNQTLNLFVCLWVILAAARRKERTAAIRISQLKAGRFLTLDGLMVAESLPYFHNQPGAPEVRIGAKKFMCVGDLPPFDHPHIFIDMGNDSEIVCPYCSTLFVYDPLLEGRCQPAECAFDPESVPEPAPPAHDISVVTASACLQPSALAMPEEKARGPKPQRSPDLR